MLKFYLVLTLSLSIGLISTAQNRKVKRYPSTVIFAGKYSFGTTAEKENVGLAYIYSGSDSTILFYLDLNAGPPSLSMGSIYGEVLINKGKGIFNASLEGYKKSCSLSFQFVNNKLIIKTVNNEDDCGFGHNVFADGTYKRISNKNPLYFIDQTGSKQYFKDLNF